MSFSLSPDQVGEPQRPAEKGGKLVGFPVLPPVPDADPSARHEEVFRLPMQLQVKRTNDQLSVTADLASVRPVKLKVGKNMVTGLKNVLFIYRDGKLILSGGEGLQGWANSNTIRNIGGILNRDTDKLPQPGEKYTVEVRLTLFETDIPGQHFWSPESGRYKVLWTKALKREVDQPKSASAQHPGSATKPVPRPAANPWSKPVNGLAGRLRIDWLEEGSSVRADVTVELKNLSFAKSLAVSNLFRLDARILDEAGKEIKVEPVITYATALVPQRWGIVPLDAYIGFPGDLRCTGSETPPQWFAKGKAVALRIGGQQWTLAAGRYTVSARLSAGKPKDGKAPPSGAPWTGVLDLPPVLIVVPDGAAAIPGAPREEQKACLPVGRWSVEFANGVTEACEIRMDGTASVVEPRRTSGGKTTRRDGSIVIAYDDDRVERWTPVGKRMVVEHWYPGSTLPAVTPVLGIAEVQVPFPSEKDSTAKLLKDLDRRGEDLESAHIRATAIDILGKRKAAVAVPQLIDLLADGTGLRGSDNYVGGHAMGVLEAITGAQLYTVDQAKWRQWWKEHGKEFVPK